MKYHKSSIDPELTQEARLLGVDLAFRALNMLETLLRFYVRKHPVPPLKSKYIAMKIYRETLLQKHHLLELYLRYGLKHFEHRFEREAFFKSFVMTWNQNKATSTPLAGPLLKDEKKRMRLQSKDVLHKEVS